ncbi:hypothetical protein DFH08DRAFT_394423 [Mycena albidolilacea]|uniref:Uncharacterized protein n=1 Tax=Mycena albidolilacea TaxID=1033008 RepID=A0AAD6ZEA0_9AGAR|nr:hypothetical protein DFH08DRAFT_394423 [Mycena albidolilacea]
MFGDQLEVSVSWRSVHGRYGRDISLPERPVSCPSSRYTFITSVMQADRWRPQLLQSRGGQRMFCFIRLSCCYPLFLVDTVRLFDFLLAVTFKPADCPFALLQTQNALCFFRSLALIVTSAPVLCAPIAALPALWRASSSRRGGRASSAVS